MLNRVQGEYINSTNDLSGVRKELLDSIGLQTKEQYDLAQSNKEIEKTAIQAGEAATESFAGMGANARQAAEGVHHFSDALSEQAAAAGRAAKEGYVGMGAPADVTQKVGVEWSPIKTGDALKEQLKEQLKDQKALGDYYGALTEKAISYTAAERQMADLKEKLKKADAEILAAGTAQVGVVQNKKMSEEQYAAALAKSAKIQEDITIGARKKNETDAEYASRMADLQVSLGKVNDSLGTHTGLIGGATEAQLKNRDAIKEQIKALEEQDAKARAMEGISVLEQSLKDGRITLDQYNERVTQINQRTGLFTEKALAASLAQTAWLQAIASGVATQEQMNAALKGTTDQLALYYAALNLLPREILISIRAELANPEIVGDILNMGHPGGMGASAPTAAANGHGSAKTSSHERGWRRTGGKRRGFYCTRWLSA